MAMESIPDDAKASPVDGRWFDENTRWYRPTWGESAKLLGWRWIYCAPLILLVALLVFYPSIWFLFLTHAWKLTVIAVALPLMAFGRAAANSIRNRKDRFCMHCGYSLEGLPDRHRCPECGEPYDWQLIDEYRRDPVFFVQRYKAARTLPRPDHAPFDAGPGRRRRSRDGT